MIEGFFLGITQGITEWLPISSEGIVILVKNTFFASEGGIVDLIRLSLFLHLGTFFAALIYFKKDVFLIIKKAFFPKENDGTRKILIFLFIATMVSGIIAFLLIGIVEKFEEIFKIGSRGINILIAAMLFITAFLQLRSKKDGLKKEDDIKIKDGFLLGFAQGLAIIPGLSRSGLTVSTLLLRKFDDTVALKLSFLMSLPIVFAGNLVLNAKMFLGGFHISDIIALGASFLVGIIMIDFLLRLTRRVNFGYFALIFGSLLMIFTLL